MGYRVIDPEAVEPTPGRPCVQRSVVDVAGLENVAFTLYEVEPGEQIPLAYYYHDDGEAQSGSNARAATPRAKEEEVFYVTAGELRVETPDGGERERSECESRRTSSDGETAFPEATCSSWNPPALSGRSSPGTPTSPSGRSCSAHRRWTTSTPTNPRPTTQNQSHE
jgi:hypothetical protein